MKDNDNNNCKGIFAQVFHTVHVARLQHPCVFKVMACIYAQQLDRVDCIQL